MTDDEDEDAAFGILEYQRWSVDRLASGRWPPYWCRVVGSRMMQKAAKAE
jgi:hypothetical protein